MQKSLTPVTGKPPSRSLNTLPCFHHRTRHTRHHPMWQRVAVCLPRRRHAPCDGVHARPPSRGWISEAGTHAGNSGGLSNAEENERLPSRKGNGTSVASLNGPEPGLGALSLSPLTSVTSPKGRAYSRHPACELRSLNAGQGGVLNPGRQSQTCRRRGSVTGDATWGLREKQGPSSPLGSRL